MKTNNEGNTGGFDLDSKFMRIFLVLLAALLVFAGPTYVPYLLGDVLKISAAIAIAFGLVLLVLGLALMWYLIRKKVIE